MSKINAIFRGLASTTIFVLGANALSLPSATAALKDKTSVGIVNFDSTSYTSNSFAVSLQTAAQKIGWTATSQDPRGDLSQANAFCTQYVTRKVDIIVVNVFEASQMAQCMAYAKQASIPVFFMASSLSNGMAGAISSVNAGPVNAVFVQHAVETKGLVALALTYNPGAPCRVREHELDAALVKAGAALKLDKHEITVPGQVTSALAATQAWLNGHPESRHENLAVWACFSEPALGAASAVKQAGRSGIPIYTWDLDKQTIDALKSGAISGSLWVDADGMAQQLIKQMKDHADGAPPREDQAASVVITPENIATFMAQHPDAYR